MRNIDRIKQMEADEIARILVNEDCDICIYNDRFCLSEDSEQCLKGIKLWLEREAK